MVLAADIGGSHITSAIIDTDKELILPGSVSRLPVDKSESAENIIQAWSKCLKNSCQFRESLNLGIAMPGPFDYSEGICYLDKSQKYGDLHGLNVKTLLADELDIYSDNIRLANDAVCFLMGEIQHLKLESRSRVLGLTLGTGLGGAHYLDDKFIDAEIWKLPFKNGIAEDYFSTRWFVKKAFDLTGHKYPGLNEILKSPGSEAVLKSIFLEFVENLTELLIIQTERYQFSHVVIGGNIAKAHVHFIGKLLRSLSQNKYDLNVQISSLGEEAALYGASLIADFERME